MGQKKRSIKYTWKQFDSDIQKIANWLSIKSFKNIYGIPKGGLVLAVKLCNIFNLPLVLNEKQISKETLICDDIADTGKTLQKFKEKGNLTVTIFFHKQTVNYPDFYLREKKDSWIIFPWE